MSLYPQPAPHAVSTAVFHLPEALVSLLGAFLLQIPFLSSMERVNKMIVGATPLRKQRIDAVIVILLKRGGWIAFKEELLTQGETSHPDEIGDFIMTLSIYSVRRQHRTPELCGSPKHFTSRPHLILEGLDCEHHCADKEAEVIWVTQLTG